VIAIETTTFTLADTRDGGRRGSPDGADPSSTNRIGIGQEERGEPGRFSE
jgi:hypothetical protein